MSVQSCQDKDCVCLLSDACLGDASVTPQDVHHLGPATYLGAPAGSRYSVIPTECRYSMGRCADDVLGNGGRTDGSDVRFVRFLSLA